MSSINPPLSVVKIAAEDEPNVLRPRDPEISATLELHPSTDPLGPRIRLSHENDKPCRLCGQISKTLIDARLQLFGA
jgi:hypothetical protein